MQFLKDNTFERISKDFSDSVSTKYQVYVASCMKQVHNVETTLNKH